MYTNNKRFEISVVVLIYIYIRSFVLTVCCTRIMLRMAIIGAPIGRVVVVDAGYEFHFGIALQCICPMMDDR